MPGAPNATESSFRFMLALSSPHRGAFTHGFESLALAPQQAAYAIEADVSAGIVLQDPWINGVVPLADEDGRHPRLPNPLDGGQDSQLVVHDYIVLRRI